MGGHARAWASMLGHGRACSGMGKHAQAWSRMLGHGRACSGMGEHATLSLITNF